MRSSTVSYHKHFAPSLLCDRRRVLRTFHPGICAKFRPATDDGVGERRTTQEDPGAPEGAQPGDGTGVSHHAAAVVVLVGSVQRRTIMSSDKGEEPCGCRLPIDGLLDLELRTASPRCETPGHVSPSQSRSVRQRWQELLKKDVF